MPFCTECGAKVKDGAHFCWNCGNPVEMEGAGVSADALGVSDGEATLGEGSDPNGMQTCSSEGYDFQSSCQECSHETASEFFSVDDLDNRLKDVESTDMKVELIHRLAVPDDADEALENALAILPRVEVEAFKKGSDDERRAELSTAWLEKVHQLIEHACQAMDDEELIIRAKLLYLRKKRDVLLVMTRE
ncbi:zinc-ribbon domain-containing protein [Collinsella tanakaei]|uniref:zinc-ribbon domain-containing protein n=1 Tax=Collinsella tanakaei TaxID=626935 RepID=UPI001F1CEDB4|nr:zinc ribbon domain-containing protein [Collinsella tanakaei]MCF2621423.1 zinc ribbon domain-containing protein [Collinsella tanakaei]